MIGTSPGCGYHPDCDVGLGVGPAPGTAVRCQASGVVPILKGVQRLWELRK